MAVPKGDVAALRAGLKTIGLDVALVEELVKAVKQEKPSKQGGFGHRVSALMGKAFSKASEGALKVSASVAANLLTELLKSYYGM